MGQFGKLPMEKFCKLMCTININVGVSVNGILEHWFLYSKPQPMPGYLGFHKWHFQHEDICCVPNLDLPT